jgi:hypothetical protein
MPDELELPTQRAIQWEMTKLLFGRGNRPMRAQETYAALAEIFNLDWKQTGHPRNTRDEPRWHNACQSARNALVKDGLMNQLPHDSWSLTQKGLRRMTVTAEELGF